MEEKLKIVIGADTDELRRELKGAKDEIEDFGDESEKAGEDFEKALEDAKATCKTAMAAIGAAIAGAITAMTALAESTREMRTNQAKLATAFESAGSSAEVAGKVYDDLYKVLGEDDTATEAAAHLAKLTTNEKELADWTNICKGVYATFGNSLPLEGLTEAVNHTAQLGEVQGTLADALEWSGVNIDDFNKELAKCTTKEEREAKIRNTLNGLYKTAATNYDKNNKKVLDANDAQNKLNKQLAKAGDYMEPMVTELKNIGASLLKDMEKPLKAVAEFLTNTFFPAVKKVYNFIKENLPAIAMAVGAVTAAYVGYKAVLLITAAATAEVTLAQKALNIVMSANPIGLVVAGVAALAAGLAIYCASTEEATVETQYLTDEEIALRDSALEAAEAFREQKTATDEHISSIQASSEHNQKLAEELLGLADSSGRVKEADEARAQFIINELNEAYGTEYEMINGVIQKYDELEAGIYDLINAKTAQAMLEAKEADYINAINEKSNALAGLLVAETDYSNQLAIFTEKELIYNKERKEAEEALAEAKRTGNIQGKRVAEQAIERLDANHKIEKDILDEKKTKYDELAANYGSVYSTIEDYTNAAMLIQQGKHDEAIELLKTEGAAYFDYADDVDLATQKAIDALFEKAVDAGLAAEDTKRNFENGVEGYTEEMVKEAQTAYEDALTEWSNAYSDASKLGTDIGTGIVDGINGQESYVLKKGRSLVNGLIAAMKSAADSHSPSKKTMAFGEDLGEGTEIGLENSTKDVIKASEDMVASSLKAISGFSAVNFSSLIGGSALNHNSVGTARTVESAETTGLLSAIGSKLSASTPIVLEVDGKVFAQTAISTINKNTRQTGKLALNLI